MPCQRPRTLDTIGGKPALIAMTKTSPIFPNSDKDSVLDKRKEMMVIMAETSFNPANICPLDQEELASFMVEHLKSFTEVENGNSSQPSQ